MSILSEQNILGDPELAQTTRPGLADLVASYSFSNQNYEMMIYEAMSNARGGNWARPTFYAPDPAIAEAEKSAPTQEAGPSGEPTASPDKPTQYGGPAGSPMTENSTQSTKLEQIAEVIADKQEPISNPVPDPMASAARSATITQESAQGPVASGGQFDGHEAANQYWQNMATEAITEPLPIESTGAMSLTSFDDPWGAQASQAADLGSDAPQGNKGNHRPMPGAPGSTDNPQKERQETTGASSVKKGGRPMPGSPGGGASPGGGQAQQMQMQQMKNKIHRPGLGGGGRAWRPGMGTPGNLDQSMRNS